MEKENSRLREQLADARTMADDAAASASSPNQAVTEAQDRTERLRTESRTDVVVDAEAAPDPAADAAEQAEQAAQDVNAALR
ncbi:hypothetical protein [Stenotrophomonas maltophilia]